MRTTILAVTVFVAIAAVSASRSARQAHYQPSGGAAANRGPAGYDAYQPQQAQAQSFRPQVQAAPQQSYDPSGFQGQPAPRGRTTVQSFGGGLARPTQQSQQGGQQSQSEEEEEEKPNPLTLLLEKSTFTCSSKTDGYYADNSVNCQVFHYCVGGAKHSWMCPEGTVFHQVHLNCVPASQDICNTAEKFFFVNDYLHKELETRGPNNTVLYAQRYYPEGYVLGDPFTAPASGQAPRAQAPPQQAQYEPQPQAPPARQAFRGQAAPRGPPAQFQPQQFQPQSPPQYSSQQPAAAPAQFGGAQPSRGSGGGGFGFPPTRTYIIPAPNKAPASDANPSYLYRQGAASNSAQSHQSSVKYDDDY